MYLGTSQGFIYRSANNGDDASWELVNQVGVLLPGAPVSAISIDPKDHRLVWASFAGDGVSRLSRPETTDLDGRTAFVLRSRDGIRFEDASGQLSGTRLPDAPISAIAAEAYNFDIAYVGTDVGVFRTSDGGVTWTAFQNGLPRSPVTELILHQKDRILFAATMGRGIYRRSLE
jgi:ligand-binding sensor domain-containing protein